MCQKSVKEIKHRGTEDTKFYYYSDNEQNKKLRVLRASVFNLFY
jgi:hypothetical protein